VTDSPLMPVYAPSPVNFVRGEGARLFDAQGRGWLDFIAGIAVNGLGHCHPALVAALKAQGEKLWHVSNLYQTDLQRSLAQRYVDATFADVVYFSNSGTEAVETALKVARKYHAANGAPERIDIIGFDGAFHGRTYGAINAAGNPNYLDGFGPRLPGYVRLTWGDHDALKEAVASPTAAAVIVEPVQGEGGVRAMPESCLVALRELCDAHGVLLILDEVQCGAGRTGKLFAHEWAGVNPDIMTVAKGVGGGFPLGACLATRKASEGMVKGTHGSTYGGNPLAMAVGHAVWDELTKPELLEHVRRISGHFTQSLEGLKDTHPDLVVDVRGKGLLRGLKLSVDPLPVRTACFERGLLCGTAGDNVLRFAPPFIIDEKDVSEAIGIIDASLTAVRASKAA
jgi:acetylornithine/N-succinyldiaminopimelate aminotransferase